MENALFFPIDIPYDIVYRNNSPEYPVGPHAHNGAEIYITLTALPDVLLGDQVFAVPADTMIIIPPFCVHQLFHETGIVYERYVLNIRDSWLKSALFDPSQLPPCLLPDNQPLLIDLSSPKSKSFKKKLTDYFRQLIMLSNTTSPHGLSVFFEMLAIITDHVQKLGNAYHALPVSAPQKKVNGIISYIQEHIREEIHISDLAGHFYLNPDYLARLFKKHAHVSLGHYLTLQKITTAQELLREGHSVASVAEELGYSSYAYFFKSFQKITGISPSRYRSQYSAYHSSD
ncbi:MAG: AraC family transcriptional regulator [Lachnospiraceae bacterium]|nr:AraC family transcriptional regulator [Lachnospiraceae bacterium]